MAVLLRPSAAPLLPDRVCSECVADFVRGEDAGAYKDIKVGGVSPVDCARAGSACFDPAVGTAMEVGGPAHQAACCALCSATEGCVGYVISSGEDAGSQHDKLAACLAEERDGAGRQVAQPRARKVHPKLQLPVVVGDRLPAHRGADRCRLRWRRQRPRRAVGRRAGQPPGAPAFCGVAGAPEPGP